MTALLTQDDVHRPDIRSQPVQEHTVYVACQDMTIHEFAAILQPRVLDGTREV